jgi:GT2 family glycosyltransferase
MPSVVDVTIVVSTHNRASTLDRLLTTLLLEQLPGDVSYDVILVDNNSTDDTAEIVKPWCRRFGSRLQYIFEPRKGVSYGRNAGVAAAGGDIVAFTDDDNEPAADWVRTIGRLFRDDPELQVCGGKVIPRWNEPVPHWLDRRHWSPLAIIDYGDEPFWTSAQRPLCLLTANLAVRRAVFDRIGGFSPVFLRCQDHEFLLRLWRSGGRALYTPELVVRAPIDPERLTLKYHRAWHVRHGKFSALMRAEEIVGRDGCLQPEPSPAGCPFGVPVHVYAEVARAVGGCIAARLRGRRAEALRREFHIGYLLGYVRRTIELSLDKRRLAEPLSGVRRAVRRYARSVSMSTPRLLLVHAIVGTLVGGSLYDIWTGREHWPLSPYPMFSIVDRDPSLRCLRIVGVTAAPHGEEFVMLDPAVIQPFDQCRLTSALSRTFHDGARRHLIHEQLRDCLHRYEERRRAGEHAGPPLAAVRLYEMYWTLDANASNVDTPDTRRLIDTVYAPKATAGF